MRTINEDIDRIKKIMGIDEGSNGPAYKGPEGYDDSCDCYPEDEDVVEGEIEEEEEGGDSAPSSPSMDKWETGLNRGKANPIDATSKWETGIQRGKGNPVW